MGNNNSEPYTQKTWKICMVCNNNKLFNSDLMVLNILVDDEHKYSNGDPTKILLLKCSKFHILKYEGNSRHIDYVLKNLTDIYKDKNTEPKNNNEIEKLKNEIVELKQQIKNLKNISNTEPTAPLEQIQIVEATLIK